MWNNRLFSQSYHLSPVKCPVSLIANATNTNTPPLGRMNQEVNSTASSLWMLPRSDNPKLKEDTSDSPPLPGN